jgi:hypothetical protein
MVYSHSKNPKFGNILEGFVMESVGTFGIFYGHMVYLMAVWYILWPFGMFYGR